MAAPAVRLCIAAIAAFSALVFSRAPVRMAGSLGRGKAEATWLKRKQGAVMAN